ADYRRPPRCRARRSPQFPSLARRITMDIKDWLLPEFDFEMQATRRTLERVPLDDPNWKPHEKSMTIGYLAHLVATLPGWTTLTLKQTELDLQPPPGKNWGDD